MYAHHNNGMANNKKVKREKPVKTLQDRQAIANAIKERFKSTLGVDIDASELEGIKKLKGILDEYSTVEMLTSGFSGKIYVDEMKRYIEYILPISQHTNELVKLVV